jgi:hypothetical protein
MYCIWGGRYASLLRHMGVRARSGGEKQSHPMASSQAVGGDCTTSPTERLRSNVGPWSVSDSPMGWAVQLGLDKSAVVRLLRLAVEGLDRAK